MQERIPSNNTSFEPTDDDRQSSELQPPQPHLLAHSFSLDPLEDRLGQAEISPCITKRHSQRLIIHRYPQWIPTSPLPRGQHVRSRYITLTPIVGVRMDGARRRRFRKGGGHRTENMRRAYNGARGSRHPRVSLSLQEVWEIGE